MNSKLYYLMTFLFVTIFSVHYAMPDEMNWRTSIWPEQYEMQYYSEDFGQSVAVGDVSGDGVDDVIVSSDYFIYIYEGPLPAQDGWNWAKPMVKIGNRHMNYVPRFDKVTLADVNNDGIMDILFGENFVYQDNSPWFIYLFYGKTEWTTSDEPLVLDDHEDSDWSVGSPSGRPGGSFGASMANAGDVNADGIDDIIVGAPRDQDKGKAYVYYGSSTGMEANQTPDGIIPPDDSWQMWQRGIGHRIEGSLGYTVAKDGHFVGSQGHISDNFIIGIPGADIDLNENGYYSEYEGEKDIGVALIGPRWWCLSGDKQRGVQFGYVLGNAGDVNGDGHPEVLVCAKKFAVPPKIFLYLGTDDRVNTSERNIPYDWSIINIPYSQTIYPNSYQKPSVGSAGDINGDGYGDIFIGDPSYNTDNTLGHDGRVYIFYGGPPTNDDPSGLGQNQTIETADIILDPSDINFSFVPNSCTSFGFCVASGDIDGDGLSDIVVGDPEAYHPHGGTQPGVTSGAVHVFYAQPQAPTYIRVTSPNGGETWQVGTQYPVTWEADQYTGAVKMYLSSDNGSSWRDITPNRCPKNDGRSRCTPISGDVSNQCLIKVVSESYPEIQDQSDAVFTIQRSTPENLIINGDFSDGMNHWYFFVNEHASAVATVQNGECFYNIRNGGTQFWHVILQQNGLNLEHGKRYRVQFDAYATASKTIVSFLGKNGEPYTAYWAETLAVTTTKQTYTYSFQMNEPTDTAARFVNEIGSSNADLYLDNISVVEDASTGFWADVDDDGDVDIIDIQLVAARWNTRVGDPNYDPKYDVDNEGLGDGDIDIIDIQLVAAWWNRPLP